MDLRWLLIVPDPAVIQYLYRHYPVPHAVTIVKIWQVITLPVTVL